MDVKDGLMMTTVDPSGIVMKNSLGTETIIIDGSNGNVGIGTTNPSATLTVQDDASALVAMFKRPSATNSVYFGWENSNSLAYMGIDGQGLTNFEPGALLMGVWRDKPIIFTTGQSNNEKMRIKNNGNVGIGTTNPTAKLEVNGDIIATNTRLHYSSHSSYAGFSHKNNTGTGNYCLIHDATGSTFLNSSSGKHIRFRNNNVDSMILTDTGRLGIGIDQPGAELDVKGTVIISSTDSADGRHFGLQIARAGITGQAYANLTLNSRANHSYEGIDFQMNGASKMFLELSGDLGIGTTSPLAPLHIIGKNAQSDQNINIVFQNRYKKTQIGIGMDDSSSDSDGDLYFLRKYPSASSWTRIGRLLEQNGNDATMNFTGAHTCRFSNEENFEIGMIVSSTGEYNNYVKTKDGDYISTSEILINEALPIVKLTNKKKDKSIFGVISNIEDGTEETRSNGSNGFQSIIYIKNDGKRLCINGLGEGGIWVVNTNGNLENGDYLQSSDISGYSEKQDDELMKNYTLGKITCDCNFDINSNIYKCEDIGNGILRAFVGCVYTCS